MTTMTRSAASASSYRYRSTKLLLFLSLLCTTARNVTAAVTTEEPQQPQPQLSDPVGGRTPKPAALQQQHLPRTTQPPQMGWNSWNLFGCDGLNEDLVKEIATAMVDSGLAGLGYEYINLDDCWQLERDPRTMEILEDPSKFPSGIPHLVEFVHGLGLKLGLYSDSGLYTCQRRPGSHGHELRDAQTYTKWKIDYLKYDNCYATGLGGGVRKRYETMRDALANATAASDSNHTIFYSLCEWGIGDPATWAGTVGDSWRTTGDIQASWKSILGNLDENDQWHEYAGPGYGWNDPDMLQVGSYTGLAEGEQRAHFTLWALIKAPLLLAYDLRSESPPPEIVTNQEIIALNQDPLGAQGYKRSSTTSVDGVGDGPLEVWAGDLDGGDVAVVLLNRSSKDQTMTVRFADVIGNSTNYDYYGGGDDDDDDDIKAHVRDLWAHEDLGVFTNEYTTPTEVPSHDVVALRLKLGSSQIEPRDSAKRLSGGLRIKTQQSTN